MWAKKRGRGSEWLREASACLSPCTPAGQSLVGRFRVLALADHVNSQPVFGVVRDPFSFYFAYKKTSSDIQIRRCQDHFSNTKSSFVHIPRY